MKNALKKAAKVLMDIHDGALRSPVGQEAIDQQVFITPKNRRPRGLCHCQHCVVVRHEEKRP